MLTGDGDTLYNVDGVKQRGARLKGTEKMKNTGLSASLREGRVHAPGMESIKSGSVSPSILMTEEGTLQTASVVAKLNPVLQQTLSRLLTLFRNLSQRPGNTAENASNNTHCKMRHNDGFFPISSPLELVVHGIVSSGWNYGEIQQPSRARSMALPRNSRGKRRWTKKLTSISIIKHHRAARDYDKETKDIGSGITIQIPGESPATETKQGYREVANAMNVSIPREDVSVLVLSDENRQRERGEGCKFGDTRTDLPDVPLVQTFTSFSTSTRHEHPFKKQQQSALIEERLMLVGKTGGTTVYLSIHNDRHPLYHDLRIGLTTTGTPLPAFNRSGAPPNKSLFLRDLAKSLTPTPGNSREWKE
ncbi:hypothetical protein EDD18DRAFT_1334942 [Armillaria luteobubalina]|uniref:Uncharacterized protein n=1 Tax=Armillaria luteobubalina TaxID=153913 RepID=A0AA39PSR9_9AGAR|nr:hypothetical protein EDD18DRAFT_1334942 [Armillaria luteobubalina]